ncbi:Succinate dehydrogenase subunit 8A mitochondrila [Zea mays]|uniref:Succinate dehydrogenase subunit 8A mitochondrila n=1 Tax=Zea mays TaxID=4577 RepID=A0A1D6NWI7_MAIZE|nr:Succinate dehydrogenase subunit 8A mitochondrila [Zea mays]
MIYRNWSLLSSTVVIWGGVATAGLAGIFLLGGKIIISLFHQKVTDIADRTDGVLFDSGDDGVGEIAQDDVQDASVL